MDVVSVCISVLRSVGRMIEQGKVKEWKAQRSPVSGVEEHMRIWNRVGRAQKSASCVRGALREGEREREDGNESDRANVDCLVPNYLELFFSQI